MATIKKNSHSTTYTASKTKLLCIACILFVVFCALSYFFFLGYLQEKYRLQIKENGVKATAEIYTVSGSSGSSNRLYKCYYQYIDENGIRYWATWGPLYSRREEAEENLGKQIEIYIDGKGESITADWEPAIGKCITFFIISFVIVCADTIGIAILSVKIHKTRMRKKSQK